MIHDPLCDPSSQGLGYIAHRRDGSAYTGYLTCDCDLIAKVRADMQPADVNAWLSIGIGHGWVSKPVCSTHDRIPTSTEEETAWDEGLDPCMPVVRIWTDGLPT